jgi:NDP-sugar pyrophosphorylase family protein
MRPQTETVPKILLPVAGRTFADWQVEWLVEEGVKRITYSIGHLGDSVRDHIGRGEQWGITVDYVEEGANLLGTAGAIRLAADRGVLDDDFFLLYGDAYLPLNLAPVESAYRRSGQPVLMTVYHNNNQGEASNVIFHNGMVELYDKNCSKPAPDMTYIDYGLSILRRDVIIEHVPSGQPADLAPLVKELSLARRVAGYEATRKYFEVGSVAGLQELERHLSRR